VREPLDHRVGHFLEAGGGLKNVHSDVAVAQGLGGASATSRARTAAAAVDRNALVSLCNRYRATEGRVLRTNIQRLQRQ